MSGFSVEKHKIPEIICEETGEVLKPASELTIKTRSDVPFRSITDLKGYEGHEVNTHVSDCDCTGYIPINKQVQMIFRSPEAFADILRVSEGEYDEDGEYIALEDPIEQMDELNDLQALQEAQIASQSTDVGGEQSAGQATTTPGEGAKPEAVSADNVD